MSVIRFIYAVILLACGFYIQAVGNKRTHHEVCASEAGTNSSGYTPTRKRTLAYSPDRTPQAGTYYANVANTGSYANLHNVIGLSRTTTHAPSPQKSHCTVVGPWLTNTETEKQVTKNHQAGVSQTVIVSSKACNSPVVQRLVEQGVDIRINDKVHTKMMYRVYTDENGVEHNHRLIGSANPTHRGYYHNLDGMAVLDRDYNSDFDANMEYIYSHSIPYHDYAAGSRIQWSPYKPRGIGKTPYKGLFNTRQYDVAAKMVESVDKIPYGGNIVASTFTFNDTNLAESLKRAKDRGVGITLYVDQKTRIPSYIQQILGDNIYYVALPHGIQHNKSLVCHDGNQAYTTYYGSNNFTRQAQQNDLNQAIITQSPTFAQRHLHALQQAISQRASNGKRILTFDDSEDT